MKRGGTMPNRILKDSICRSEEIDRLSYFIEVMFYRLIVTCDDYGRYDARIRIIKNMCFPLKDVTEKDIENGIKTLVDAGLIVVYEYEGKPYLQLVTWNKHQSTRAQRSKYPAYSEKTCILLYTNDNESMKTAAKRISKAVEEEKKEQPVITLLLNTGAEYGIVQKDIDEWKELYPAVDVMQELRNMKGWCKENKAKRKTERGIRRFITGWLAREQDSGGTRGYINKSVMQSPSYGNITEKLLNENRSDLN